MRSIAVLIIFQRFNVPCKPFPVILDGEGLFVFNGLRFRVAAGRSWVGCGFGVLSGRSSIVGHYRGFDVGSTGPGKLRATPSGPLNRSELQKGGRTSINGPETPYNQAVGSFDSR